MTLEDGLEDGMEDGMEDDNYKTKIESTNILTMKCQQHTTYDFQYFIRMPLFSTIS